MVREQLVARGVRDPLVLAAMGAIPREQFVPADLIERAYADSALTIGGGQTISQPYIVARMSEALQLGPAVEAGHRPRSSRSGRAPATRRRSWRGWAPRS